MTTAPRIGITTSITTDGSSPERAFVNSTYIRAVQQAGGLPILLPPQLEPWARQALHEMIDGLLLTGGGDVDPAQFHETPHEKTSDVSRERDGLELDLARRAVDRAVPLLAICRGLQVLNVALGGSLVQDIPTETSSTVDHSQKARQKTARDEPVHPVKVADGTRLAAILGGPEVEVNSFHHQALKRLGRGLKPVAWAPDDTVEGVEMPQARALVVGVQWHPEELVDRDPAARSLFRALVEAAAAARR
ncbi:MAG: gamma-glutamyl-gamma-aminobutyrate hydrolase family protein [Candidatus Rokubacteria bacterium]|nr:gamma-glutamyl-gamma-aminobutyrate hydrolase family protein [Candidatus Rokubacteria bacterium]